jgi:hypothetical protein
MAEILSFVALAFLLQRKTQPVKPKKKVVKAWRRAKTLAKVVKMYLTLNIFIVQSMMF